MSQRTKQIGLVIALIAYSALIYFMSDQPGLSSGLAFDFVMRKFAHAGEYGLLAILSYYTFASFMPKAKNTKVLFLLALVFSILYAITDEYHQSLVPDRNGSVYDVMFDAAGAIGGLLVIHLLPRLGKTISFGKK